MSATLTMVALAKIKAREGFNPRSDFGDEQMAELVASVKRHGIITPLTRDADGEALTLAVAENVIRADLTPVEEAEAYRRLLEEHGDTAKVAKLVGRSERLIGERVELLRLPDETRALVAARKVPLSCAPLLVRIAEREPLLADLTAVWLV